MSQYSIANHTILPLLFRVIRNQRLSYLLKDPSTSSLILFNPHHFDHDLFHHIRNIQKQTNTQLTHIVTNDIREDIIEKSSNKSIKLINPLTCQQLKPQIIGDLSICLIKANGFQKQFSLIGVTHMTSDSTKLPVLFTDELLTVCGINTESTCKPEEYLSSLQKLKFFPNETYIFPSHTVLEENLLFAKAIGVNPIIDQKISLYNESKKFPDCLIPTTVGEQKMLNPFLHADKYNSLLGSTDRKKCFQLLREARRKWQK